MVSGLGLQPPKLLAAGLAIKSVSNYHGIQSFNCNRAGFTIIASTIGEELLREEANHLALSVVHQVEQELLRVLAILLGNNGANKFVFINLFFL